MKKRLLGLMMVVFVAVLPVFVNAEEMVAKIGEEEFATLIEAVEAVEAKETITVLKDTESVGIVVEGGKEFTLDFNGHTVTFTTDVGSTGTISNNMQLLEGSTLVFKNGTLKSASPNGKMLIQNYSSLTLEDMTLDGRTDLLLYALSNNSGDVNLIGETNIYVNEGKVAFDVCGFSTYEIGPKVTVNTTGTIEGIIEVTKESTAANERALSLVIKNINHVGELSIQEGLENNVTIESGSYTDETVAEIITPTEGSDVYEVITTEGILQYVVAEDTSIEEGYFGLGFSEEGFEEVFGQEAEYEEVMGLIKDKLAEKYTAAIYYEMVYGDLINNKFVLGTEVEELESAIKVTLDIPTTLEKLKEGYNRKYLVIRLHENKDGKFEATVLDAKDNGDGTVSFETDKFSTYVLAYEDVKNVDNPKTFDSASLYIILGGLSLIGLATVSVLLKKRNA